MPVRASRFTWRRRQRRPPPSSSLPTDCLLHVFLHLDPVSIVRCAAVSRHWRRAVIDNASEIRRHPTGHADRCLLMGFHYREMYPGELSFSRRSSWLPPAGRHWSDDVPTPSYMPEAEGTRTKLYAPLACSDGLLLLCRGLTSEIAVVNPFTGFHTSITRPGGELVKYRYFLHSCHGAERNPRPNSFQVLAMDISLDQGILTLQNYCSESGAWVPVFRPNAAGAGELRMPHRDYPSVAPIACRGIIYWLCTSESDYQRHLERDKITHVVAVDIGSGVATMMRLPKRRSMSNRDVSVGKMLMLATSSEGDRLSLLRREETGLEVSVWLYAGDLGGGGGDDDDDPEKSWLLRESIDIRKLIEDAGLSRFRLGCKDWEVLETRLEWFCPRSRSVILWIPFLGLLVLDLGSKMIQRAAGDSHGHIWPYEIDLTLCFSSMKPF